MACLELSYREIFRASIAPMKCSWRVDGEQTELRDITDSWSIREFGMQSGRANIHMIWRVSDALLSAREHLASSIPAVKRMDMRFGMARSSDAIVLMRGT